MSKHNDNEFQENLKLTFKNGFEKQFRNGLAQGMYATCKVVYDKLSDDGKSVEDRLNDVMAFCTPILETRKQNAQDEQKAAE